ncbi:ATP-dependent DNA helicase Q4 [Ciona intestinalis]
MPVENDFKSELPFMDLKVKIKMWEITFAKQHGRKPGKNDISTDAIARDMYIKYAKKEKENIPVAVAVAEKSKSVWGESLLKANTLPPDMDDHVETAKEDEEKKEEVEIVEEVPSFRDNLKRNLKSSFTRPRSTAFKKSYLSETLNSDENNKNVKLVNLNEEISKDSFENKGVKVLASHNSNLVPQQTCAAAKPKAFTAFGQNRKILNSSVSLSWINEQSDDLSDLLNLEENVKNEKKMKKIEEELDNMSEVPSKDEKTNLTKVTEQATVGLGEKLVCVTENSSVDMASTGHEAGKDTSTLPVPSDPVQAGEKISDDFFPAHLNKSEESPPARKPEKTESEDIETSQQNEKGAKSTSKGGGSSGGGGGLASTNFRRLNMKQKTFSRKGGQGRFLRKQVFREKLSKKGFSFRSGWKGRSGGSSLGGGGGYRDRSEDKCFKCGETGHWASKCTGKFKGKAKEQDAESKASWDKFLENLVSDPASEPLSYSSQQFQQTQITLEHAEPLYTEDSFNEDEVYSVLKKFGFSEFRTGQLQAMKRILLGKPTLLVLSTGSGKSLCYQLPAYMYAMKRSSITLVISPLVSLMDDQVHGLPKFLRATRLHSGMTKEQREKSMVEIQNGNVDILLVSPEALTSWAGMSPYYSPLAKLPPISFVCVDECHCLSEWSHSFRPSYLRVCKVLKDQLGIKCLVGLTATSTRSTCISVAKQLGITDPRHGMILSMSLPKNLSLSISKDRYKDEALEMLLNGDRFRKLDSVIIYCTRRDEVARVSSYLRTRMQREPTEAEAEPEEQIVEGNSKKRKRSAKPKSSKKRAFTIEADCYHAGMSAAQRRSVQKRFMSGKLRIVVATVAFGMGIDKHDVRAVIHYNMPRSFERYVQEVGRAGRDRLPAECHLFLDAEGGDLSELSRHTYGKGVDRFMVKKLVRCVFPSCKCAASNKECIGHYAAIPIDAIIQELDITREGVETLLCYLELDGLVNVFLPTETKCRIHCYGGIPQMQKTILKCSAVAIAVKMKDKDELSGNEVEFALDKVANELCLDIVNLKRNLRQLEWDTTLSEEPGKRGKSGISVEFSDLSFLIHTKQSTSNELLDEVTASLHTRIMSQEKKEIAQLKTCFNAMQKFCFPNAGCCMDDFTSPRSEQLKEVIDAYFQEEENSKSNDQTEPLQSSDEEDIRSSVRQFLYVHGGDLGDKVTGRAIARIFHGIDSPCYPARNWGPARRFWRSKLNYDFNSVLKLATEELIKFR